VNRSDHFPLEVFRSYFEQEDEDVMNSLISTAFWCICRSHGVNHAKSNAAKGAAKQEVGKTSPQLLESSSASGAEIIEDSAATFKPDLVTQFQGDPKEYMSTFAADISRILSAIPLLNSNVVIGLPVEGHLSPEQAHAVVTAAVKLDASARNSLPLTCCAWQGNPITQLQPFRFQWNFF
jgi:hypothetical protein